MRKLILMSIFVSPEMQGKSIGKTMMKRLETYAVKMGVSGFYVENVVNPGFFESCGFKDQGILWSKDLEPNVSYQLPDFITEAQIRVVKDDFEPSRENHLFAWYNKDTGEAVVKVRVRFG